MRFFIGMMALLSALASIVYADTLSNVVQSGRLRVCVWPEYYGISYVNPRTQQLEGIDVDLAKAFASDLGVSVLFVPSSFATLIADITQKKCDIAMFAIGQTPQRKEHLTLTTPHLASDIYAIATKNNRRIQSWEDIDKQGVVVAVAKGTYHVEVMQNALKNATLQILENLHAREQEVESGRADVFMSDYPFGMRMLAQRDWAKIIKPSSVFHITPYGWAIAQNEPEWHKRVEAFIATIKKDGRLLSAAQKHHLEPIVLQK